MYLSLFLTTRVSRNGRLFDSSFSMVNLMLGCCLFRYSRMALVVVLSFSVAKISSTYLNHLFIPILLSTCIVFFSNSAMKMFANKGPRGEPMLTPSTWSKKSLLNWKWDCWVHKQFGGAHVWSNRVIIRAYSRDYWSDRSVILVDFWKAIEYSCFWAAR